MRPVRKAVFPVAGLGTRILPATKAIPKEMLPVVDKPLIQYAVEEAREAGIEQIIFVTGRAVRLADERGVKLWELGLDDLRSIDERIETGVFNVLSPDASVKSRTSFGGTRIVDMLVGDPLPRIC